MQARKWLLWDAVNSLWRIELEENYSSLDMVGNWTPTERLQIGKLQDLYQGPSYLFVAGAMFAVDSALFYAQSIVTSGAPIWPASHVSDFGRLSSTDNQRARLLVAMCQKKLLGTDFPFTGNW